MCAVAFADHLSNSVSENGLLSYCLVAFFTLYAVVIVVSLFFIRTMDDAVRLLSEVAKVLGPIAGVIVTFYYERER
jgi:hypothetical protein